MSSPVWKPVPDFDGVYEVSSEGQVRRVAPGHGATPGRLLQPGIGYGGYPVVRLTRDGRSSKRYVHRLVAAAFIGPCPPGHEVNHKDRDRLNPRRENLEYVTHSENAKHAHRNGVIPCRGERKPNCKLSVEAVADIRASGEGARALGRRFGVHHMTIVNIRRMRKWRHVPEIEAVLKGGGR